MSTRFMQTILLSGTDGKKKESYIAKLLQEHGVQPVDITLVDFFEDKKGTKKQSIGVSEIREFQKKVNLRPIKSDSKLVIFRNADSLTHAAQNALLKTLEEPPNHTIIILLATDTSAFLPTILSRCFLVSFEKQKEEKQTIQPLSQFSSIGGLLFTAQEKGKDKKAALQFLTEQIHFLHNLFIHSEKPDNTLVVKLTHLQKTYTLIKTTNVNPHIALETALLELHAHAAGLEAKTF